jgi:gluconate kinase
MTAGRSGPAVVIITGIQASGKSTVGLLLAERIPRSAFIDGDDLASMVVSGREGMTPDPSNEAIAQLQLRYAQAASLADSFHREGFTAVRCDNLYGEDLQCQVDRVRSTPLIVVVLTPTDAAVVERETARGTRAYRDWMGQGTLEAALGEFQRYLADATARPLARHDRTYRRRDSCHDH